MSKPELRIVKSDLDNYYGLETEDGDIIVPKFYNSIEEELPGVLFKATFEGETYLLNHRGELQQPSNFPAPHYQYLIQAYELVLLLAEQLVVQPKDVEEALEKINKSSSTVAEILERKS